MTLSAIVLAAGQGTRMKSKKPKVAHEILGKPMVNWAIDAARGAGAENVVVVLGHGKDHVEPLCKGCETVTQEQQLGTGDAVKSARAALKGQTGSVIVTYGDCPLMTSEVLQKLVEIRESENHAAVVLTMTLDDATGYGRIVRDTTGKILKNVEQKDCTPEQAKIKEANAGFYCFDIKALFDALSKLNNNNAAGEYYLTDVIEILVNDGQSVEGYCAPDVSVAEGVNSRVQLEQATQILRARINKKHMENGVTMWDSSSVYIGPDVEIASDVEILPNVILMGQTKIAEECVVGPNSRITDTVVGPRVKLNETIAENVTIDEEANCGPRCYLRGGAHLCKKAKAGTHVEIKGSTIGEGSKVPHLSYIGDCTMGEGGNLGGGTITCNYDGKNKNKTVIGKNAFVGSDTMLVAPVTLGDNVLIAAGSVITEDVPDDSLAFGRARQTTKVGRNKKEGE